MTSHPQPPVQSTFVIGPADEPPAPATVEPGSIIGEYEVLDLLGQGAMGSVFRVRHLILGTEYALKMVVAHSQKALREERFLREAQATAQITHPNVVRVHYSGLTDDGQVYLVMELLEGRSLSAVIAEGPVEATRAARIVRQVAAGLAEIHRQGFVHRDIKPSNLMVVGSGEAETIKILDLGLVGFRETADTVRLTQHGHLMGTPLYMAPEALSSGTFSIQTDLYSLGALLYEMLVGRPPFDGTLKEIFWHHHVSPPPPLPYCHGLEEVAFWLLEKQPARRPSTADLVISEIDRRMKANQVSQRIEDAPSRVRRSISRRLAPRSPNGPDWVVRIVVFATIVTLIALGAWVTYGDRSSGSDDTRVEPLAETNRIDPPAVPVAPIPAAPVPAAPAPITPTLAVPTSPSPVPTQSARSLRRASPKETRPSGPKEVTITSDPSGAIVQTDAGRLGLTPLSVAIERGKTVVFRIAMDGYGEKQIVLPPKSTKTTFHVRLAAEASR